MKLILKKFFIIAIIASLTINLAFCKSPANGVFAFGNISHPKITEHAFIAAIKDDGNCNVKNPHYEKMDTLREYSNMPDFDEGKEAFRYHFFNRKEDNFNCDLSNLDNNKNAYSRMVYHYSKSIKCAENGKNKESLKELGRSLHFLQDMCCPVHIWGYGFNLMMYDSHNFLEALWDDMWKSEEIYSSIAKSRLSCVIDHEDYSQQWGTVEDLAWYFHDETSNTYKDFIKKAKSMGKKFYAGLTIGFEVPVVIKGLLETKGFAFPHKEKPNCGFERCWYYIFDIPYRASYELIRLWIRDLKDRRINVEEILE